MSESQVKTAVSAVDRAKASALLLSSSLLTDRMMLYSDLLTTLTEKADVTVWATSRNDESSAPVWQGTSARVERFPVVHPFREFPYNYLRRLNEFTWDFKLRPPSRMSMMRHVRNKIQARHVRALRLPARAIAALSLEQKLEFMVERALLSYPRSAESSQRLAELSPDLVVTTGPHRFEEPGVLREAKQQNISTMALITSWDNLSTKHRMVFQYDGFLLWSEQMKKELGEFYPATRDTPSYVTGAPQFDVFFQPQFDQSRQQFCVEQGLDPELPVVLYVLGSPNFVREHHGAAFLAQRVEAGDLGNVQLLVRPHPLFDNGAEANELRGYGSRVVVQRTGATGQALVARSQDHDQIRDWVNTFRHANVLVNMGSTATIDAAVCDVPAIILDYDPEPGRPNQALVNDTNHVWTHLRPVVSSGGITLVDSPEALVEAVRVYLRKPELHRERRRWMAEHVCGFIDGKNGERMANAIEDFLYSRKHLPKAASVRSATSST